MKRIPVRHNRLCPGCPLLLQSTGGGIEGRKPSGFRGRYRGSRIGSRGSPITVGIRLAQYGKKGQAQGGSENWKRMGETVVSGGNGPTKVKIRGNTVLVPVTLAYGGYEVDVHLVPGHRRFENDDQRRDCSRFYP